jgi:hypothetical protein
MMASLLRDESLDVTFLLLMFGLVTSLLLVWLAS